MITERIPVKTKGLAVSSTPVTVDAEGLEVTVYASDADVLLKADAGTTDANAYILKNGGSITLSGRFVLKAASAANVRLLYCKLL